MEDKKGPGPKKKVAVRVRSIDKTEEPVILDKKIEGTPVMTRTREETEEEKRGASGAYYGEASSPGKKLTPLSPEKQKQGKRDLGKIAPKDLSYYVTEKLKYRNAEVPDASAIEAIDNISRVIDSRKLTNTTNVKSAFEGAGRKKLLEEAGINEDKFNLLNKNGGLLQSALIRTNEKREDLGKSRVKSSSFVVGSTGATPPESKKITEDGIDKAVRLVKDNKGNVTTEMKVIK
jgi:hypothetical protein